MQGIPDRLGRVLLLVYILGVPTAAATATKALETTTAPKAPTAPADLDGQAGEPIERAEPLFPDHLVDVLGVDLDVAEMAREDNLVLVTLKRPDCPVCLEQLVRLRSRLPELEACGVRFIVLSPGPIDAVKRASKASSFPYPFVADVDLSIAEALGLARPRGEIFPCMLQILPDRRVGWRQLGRNGFYFGDAELKQFFECSRAV